jgi:beta-glucosidase
MRLHGTAADDLDAAVQALRDGTMTVDMEDGVYYAQLARAVSEGKVTIAQIDREVLRALAFKRKLGLFENPYVPENLEKQVRVSAAHRAAAARDRAQIHRAVEERWRAAAARAKRVLRHRPLADASADMLGPGTPRPRGRRGERARGAEGPRAALPARR